MNTNNSNHAKLLNVALNNNNFSLTEKFLIISEKNNNIKIDLDRISNVRIEKHRVLLINYFFIFLILLSYYLLDKLLASNITFHFILNLVLFTTILFSLRIKKYSHSILINTSDLNFNKFMIKKPNTPIRYC
jgi:hypothetical protein